MENRPTLPPNGHWLPGPIYPLCMCFSGQLEHCVGVVVFRGGVVLIAAICLASAAAARLSFVKHLESELPTSWADAFLLPPSMTDAFLKCNNDWCIFTPPFLSSSSYPTPIQSCWCIMLHQPPAGRVMYQMCWCGEGQLSVFPDWSMLSGVTTFGPPATVFIHYKACPLLLSFRQSIINTVSQKKGKKKSILAKSVCSVHPENTSVLEPSLQPWHRTHCVWVTTESMSSFFLLDLELS